MSKFTLCIVFSLLSMLVCAQSHINIKLDDLSKPTDTLVEKSIEEIYNLMAISRVDIRDYNYSTPFVSQLLKHSKLPEQLVNYKHNSFFEGMRRAYADHRPFTISPDMLWLLISQGFAFHINLKPEKYRDKFVSHEDKKRLVVYSGADFESIDWEEAVDGLTEQIELNTKGNIAEIFACDFSTSTQAEIITSKITLMSTVKEYYEYEIVYVVCGIPEITLLGTPKDWQKVIDKILAIKDYDIGLDWWIDAILPILKEIKKSTVGDVDIEFWRNIFMYDNGGLCDIQSRPYADGWIVKFFPYTEKGERLSLERLYKLNLPDETVKVPAVAINAQTNERTDIELCAGFIGLEQDKTTFGLTPKIGWFVHKIDPPKVEFKKHVDIMSIDVEDKSISEEFSKVKSVNRLIYNVMWDFFYGELHLIKHLKIDTLDLTRRSFSHLDSLSVILPDTYIRIDGVELSEYIKKY